MIWAQLSAVVIVSSAGLAALALGSDRRLGIVGLPILGGAVVLFVVACLGPLGQSDAAVELFFLSIGAFVCAAGASTFRHSDPEAALGCGVLLLLTIGGSVLVALGLPAACEQAARKREEQLPRQREEKARAAARAQQRVALGGRYRRLAARRWGSGRRRSP